MTEHCSCIQDGNALDKFVALPRAGRKAKIKARLNRPSRNGCDSALMTDWVERFEAYDDMTYPDDSALVALAARLMRRRGDD